MRCGRWVQEQRLGQGYQWISQADAQRGVKRKRRRGAVRVAVLATESNVQVKSVRDNTNCFILAVAKNRKRRRDHSMHVLHSLCQKLSAVIPARECRRKSGLFIRIFLSVFIVLGPFRQTILVVSCSE